MTHLYSIFLWQPPRGPTDEGRWMVQALRREIDGLKRQKA